MIRLLGIIGSFASLVGLIFNMRPPNADFSTNQTWWLGLTITVGAGALICEGCKIVRNMPKTFSNPDKIVEYMLKWIAVDGQVAIFTRDMSWAQKAEVKVLLCEKAAKNELSIILPKATALSDELRGKGGHIYTYEELHYEPTSRFTVVQMGREGARVAIGRGIRGKHRIDEFSEGEHPVFAVASDMIEIVKRLDQHRSGKVKP